LSKITRIDNFYEWYTENFPLRDEPKKTDVRFCGHTFEPQDVDRRDRSYDLRDLREQN